MTTFIQFIECPQAYPTSQILTSNPSFLTNMLSLITKSSDPLIANERECYVYPLRSANILCSGDTYKLLCTPPHLNYIFLHICPPQQILLGYINQVLLSLVHKTPQIYQYLKDHPQHLSAMVGCDRVLEAMKEFLCALLTESTMDLYTFLKSMCVRMLMNRTVKDRNVVVLSTLYCCYEAVRKTVPMSGEEEELDCVRRCFEDQTFVEVLLVQVDYSQKEYTLHIAKYLKLVAENHAEHLLPHIALLHQMFEEHENSCHFHKHLQNHVMEMLKMECEVVKRRYNTLQEEIKQGGMSQVVEEVVKRLLVYSSIYDSHSILHCLVLQMVQFIYNHNGSRYLSTVIAFFRQTQGRSQYGFNALRMKIAQFWRDNKLLQQCEEDKQFIIDQTIMYNRVAQCKYYKYSSRVVSKE